MRLLFLDDSYARRIGYLGYGGYCVAGDLVREFAADIIQVKKRHGVPRSIEVKWSPPKGHFLRTSLPGTRHDLYSDLLGLLEKYDARVLCAVHCLPECYGVRLHGWKPDRAALWAAKQQLMFLAERFQDNYLAPMDDVGLIVSDQYGSREGEANLVQNFSFDMIVGTDYTSLDRIALPPLMAASHQNALLQLADVVVGVMVGALSGSKYGKALINRIALRMLTRPAPLTGSYVGTYSAGVLGYGLKLFPSGFKPKDREFLDDFDDRYHVKNGVFSKRASP